MENCPVRGRTGKAPAVETSWSDMPIDILLQIFALLTVLDRLMNVAAVCRSWGSACSNAIFSSTLDISELRKHLDSQQSDARATLELLFRRGVSLGRKKLTTLILDTAFKVNDNHLIYAAERCPNVKKLVLPSPNGTTDHGLANAFRFWPNLESLYTSLPIHLPYLNIFKIIGENCQNLTVLKISASSFKKETALGVARFMPRVKVLGLRCATVTSDSAETLMDLLGNLDELYISIRKLGLMRRFQRPIRPQIVYKPSVLQRASRLRVYHVCYKGECNSCIASTMGQPSSNVV